MDQIARDATASSSTSTCILHHEGQVEKPMPEIAMTGRDLSRSCTSTSIHLHEGQVEKPMPETAMTGRDLSPVVSNETEPSISANANVSNVSNTVSPSMSMHVQSGMQLCIRCLSRQEWEC
jgi:hypothetical protein